MAPTSFKDLSAKQNESLLSYFFKALEETPHLVSILFSVPEQSNRLFDLLFDLLVALGGLHSVSRPHQIVVVSLHDFDVDPTGEGWSFYQFDFLVWESLLQDVLESACCTPETSADAILHVDLLAHYKYILLRH